MKILLDNGHGLNTIGKRSPVWEDGSQLFEWEFNRAIVKRIKKILINEDVEIIVPERIDVSLSERARRINDIASKEDCFLISVHANAGGGTGWEVWTSKGETKSDEYADIFFNTAQSFFGDKWRLRKDTSDGDFDKEANFYILRKTICPAILTENFFMDNIRDCEFLLSESGRDMIAEMHVAAILKIL